MHVEKGGVSGGDLAISLGELSGVYLYIFLSSLFRLFNYPERYRLILSLTGISLAVNVLGLNLGRQLAVSHQSIIIDLD